MSEDLIGKTINGYEILRQVGSGGMATVFLARQQSMNRNVALKFLPSNFINDDTYLQRFEREVKIVAQLEHRNIVPVYDYGEHDGQPFIVMRYMSSGSIEDLLTTGNIPISRVVSIAEQIASALDFAHQNGILHRDLKPSNILLDDGGGAFITDFWNRPHPGRDQQYAHNAGRCRHSKLYVAGTGPWRGARWTKRHLFAGRDALRDDLWSPSL